MPLRSQQTGPVDRAVADLEEQIRALEAQMRRVESGGSVNEPPRRTVGESIRALLSPPKSQPARRTTTPSSFVVQANPMQELEADTIPFAVKSEPDLFAQPAVDKSSAATVTDRKLLQYLSAGGSRTYKPLKREQRESRNRFFIWLGLAVVVLCLLYIVVR